MFGWFIDERDIQEGTLKKFIGAMGISYYIIIMQVVIEFDCT